MESSYYLDTGIDYSKLDPDDPEYDDFDISLVEEGLTKEAKSILKLLEEKIFIIDVIIEEGRKKGEAIGNPDYYKEYYTDFYNTMILQLMHGYEHEEFRTHPVHFKFHESDIVVDHLQFRYFVCNLAFWYPVITVAPETLGEDNIIREPMGKLMQTSFIADYMNRTYAVPYASVLDSRERSETFADTNFLIMQIPIKFADYIGTSIDIEQFRDMCKRMPEFEDGLYQKLDVTLQPAEMEAQKKKIDEHQIKMIINDDELTTMRIMLSSNSIKLQQVAELIGIIGTKPAGNGNTLPIPINGNWIVDGLSDVIDYFINCISGRNAAIINHEFMGSAGYLLILVALLCIDVKLSKTVDDCHTANPVPTIIRSKAHLMKLDGRWYRFNQRDSYHCINAQYDEDLIGQTVWLRSPVTCTAPDGICRMCYGELYHTNKTLHSVGCYAAFNQMNPLVQGLLSAKHTQKPNSVKIEFNHEFNKFFTLATTEVVLNPSFNDTIEYSLVVLLDDLHSSDFTDEDDSISIESKFGKGKKRRRKDDEDEDILEDEKDLRLDYYVQKFYVVRYLHSKKKGVQEIIEIADVNSAELYMHKDFLARMTRVNDKVFDDMPYLYIDLDDIGLEEFIFMIDVQNNEQTVPMKKMKLLIHNREHSGAKTLEDMVQMMLDLTIASGFDAVSVHGEIIIRQLIRRVDNALRRPDFSRIVMPGDYTIMSVLTALKQNPSISVSMSSSYLKYQLVQLLLTYDKRDTSDIDYWYKRTLAWDENELWYGIPSDILERSSIRHEC